MATAHFSLAPVHQSYLLEARQMQALSFAVHIPPSTSPPTPLGWRIAGLNASSVRAR